MTLRSDSDRWLAAALPAIAILLSGWLFLLKAASAEERLLRRRIENQGSLTSRQAQIESARADLESLVSEAETLRTKTGGERPIFDRSQSLRRISVLCDALGIRIGATERDKGGSRLPAAIASAVPAMVSGDPDAPQVWRIEISGPYPSVVKLLQDLASSSPVLVPLNLTMEGDPKERLMPVWNLYVLL